MEQKSFDFNRHQPDPTCLQIPQAQQQQLIELMASLIITVFQSSEEKEYVPPK